MFLVLPLRHTLLISIFCIAPLAAQVEFWTLSGNSSDVNASADGRTVADRLNSNSYNGYVGEMVLMPTDSALLDGLPTDAPGLIEADGTGEYAGVRGIVGFCIDSETSFRNSGDRFDFNSYVPLDYNEANNRYNGVNNGSGNGVASYRNGGLLRAAYMIDKFYEEAHQAGNSQSAALQTAIWEVLYDANPDVGTGNGNYYVRNNTGDDDTDRVSNRIIGITDTWFAAAEADNWGGPNYDPTGRVIFWLDPTDTDNNQSIITLNPWDGVAPIPEVGTSFSLVFGIGILLTLRRRI